MSVILTVSYEEEKELQKVINEQPRYLRVRRHKYNGGKYKKADIWLKD